MENQENLNLPIESNQTLVAKLALAASVEKMRELTPDELSIVSGGRMQGAVFN